MNWSYWKQLKEACDSIQGRRFTPAGVPRETSGLSRLDEIDVALADRNHFLLTARKQPI